jgi:diguanylate cyclase (GGDEF)-like protein
MLSSELDRAKRALSLAQDRIAELTRTQLAMSGTLGQLTEQASTDALTGLSNRRRFMEALKTTYLAATSRDLPFSVIMLDIDSFKSYNDSFGHAEGDKVIWVVAKLLLRNSGGDHIVARYGGEEFAILLPGTDGPLALELAERHRAAIASYPWPTRPVSASFGISTLDRTTRDPGTVLEEADRALYNSKRRGRNRVTHHRDIDNSLPASSGVVPPSDCSEMIEIPSHPGPECPPTNGADPAPAETFQVRKPAPSWPIPKENVVRTHLTDGAWDVLERFIQSLQGSEAADLRDVLSAIREGIEAEVVFLCNDQNGEVLGTVGDHVPFPEWYHQLTRKLSVELPSGGIWKPSEDCSKDNPMVVPDQEPSILVACRAPLSRFPHLLARRLASCPGDLAAPRRPPPARPRP